MSGNEETQKVYPLSDLIGGISKALAESHYYISRVTYDQIKAFTNYDNPGNPTVKHHIINFKLNGKNYSFPTIALMPPPILEVSDATVTVDASIVSFDSNTGDIIISHNNSDAKNASITFTVKNQHAKPEIYHKMLEHYHKDGITVNDGDVIYDSSPPVYSGGAFTVLAANDPAANNVKGYLQNHYGSIASGNDAGITIGSIQYDFSEIIAVRGRIGGLIIRSSQFTEENRFSRESRGDFDHFEINIASYTDPDQNITLDFSESEWNSGSNELVWSGIPEWMYEVPVSTDSAPSGYIISINAK